MSRSTLLAQLADAGHTVPAHRLEYLISTGRLSRPKVIAGRRLYTRRHLRQAINALNGIAAAKKRGGRRRGTSH